MTARIAWLVCLLALAGAIVVRPLWYDEILGHFMSGLAWPDEVIAASTAGIDLQPPGWYGLAWIAEIATGSDRGPRWLALLGFGVAVILVGRFAAQRFGSLGGVVAAAALILTKASAYAIDGRPYGLLLGLTASAFWVWHRGTQPGSSRVWAALLACLLAASLCVHYFAVLAWIPIGVAELARWIRARRIDSSVLAALAVGLAPLLWLLPHARAAGRAMHVGPITHPAARFAGKHYASLLDVLAFLLIALLVAVAVRRRWFQGGARGFATRIGAMLREPEALFLAALLLTPVWSLILARLGGSGLSNSRYALTFTLGAALAAGALAGALQLSPNWNRRLAVLVLAGAAVVSVRRLVMAWNERAELDATIVTTAPAGVAIVYANAFEGLKRWYQADPALRERMVLAADVEAALRRGDPATVSVNLSAAGRFFPLPVASWPEIRARHAQIALVEEPGVATWLTREIEAGAFARRPLPAPAGVEIWLVDLR